MCVCVCVCVLQVFEIQALNSKQWFTLLTPVEARYVRIDITQYEHNACLRMELYGCIDKDKGKCGMSHVIMSKTLTLMFM